MQSIEEEFGEVRLDPDNKDIIRSFVRELKALCPDVLILSGLAYGVDIHAHRAALEGGPPSFGPGFTCPGLLGDMPGAACREVESPACTMKSRMTRWAKAFPSGAVWETPFVRSVASYMPI